MQAQLLSRVDTQACMRRYYVNAKNVPKALQWIPSVSLIKHAFEGLCDNEFPGLTFDPKSADGSGDILQGEQVHTSPFFLCHSLSNPCILWPHKPPLDGHNNEQTQALSVNTCMLVQVLQRLGFEDSTVSKTARAQTRILLFNYWVTYCILKARKPSFQPMEPVAA